MKSAAPPRNTRRLPAEHSAIDRLSNFEQIAATFRCSGTVCCELKGQHTMGTWSPPVERPAPPAFRRQDAPSLRERHGADIERLMRCDDGISPDCNDASACIRPRCSCPCSGCSGSVFLIV